MFTCIIRESPAVMVKHKPTFFPRFDFSAHLDEESSAGFICDGQMKAGVGVVPGSFNVAVKIKVVFSYREVASQES